MKTEDRTKVVILSIVAVYLLFIIAYITLRRCFLTRRVEVNERLNKAHSKFAEELIQVKNHRTARAA